jgi:hypothetical protein
LHLYLDETGKYPELRVDLTVPDHSPRTPAKSVLLNLISSQLLLYRITASFGPLPVMNVNHGKQCWRVSFIKRDDDSCRLDIFDWEGWPAVSFWGNNRSSGEALQLLDWLVGKNCPSPYDYILAGSHS